MLYKHRNTSNTSLSDDNDDEEPKNSTFFAGNDHPLDLLTVAPAQWSAKSRIVPSMAALTMAPLSPMSRLPPEILIHILKHLHSARDLYSVLRVSRTWCECSVELLWHKPSFSKFDTLNKMVKVICSSDQTFTYAQFVRRLNFLSLATSLKDDIFMRLTRCDRLERLTLVNCEKISSDALIRVLPCCPNLVAIDLTGVVRVNDAAIVGLAQSAQRLQGINLAGCKQITDVGVMALAKNCPLLRRVKLSGVDLITDAPISALAKLCPLLLEIDLNNCKRITDVSIRDIWTYSTHMREMRLSQCVELTDAAFPAPPKPETRPLPPDPNPFPSSIAKPSDELPPLVLSRSFEHLRMLDLTACSNLTDDAIEGIISHGPKIRNLVLSKCVKLTDKSVESICRLGRHLHYLHLGHASNITDRSVRTLARSCTRLRYIDFANCAHLTDMSVFELAALPKLRRVGLVRVNNLTDEAVYALAERHATLERIHLSYCDQITVQAIHFLLQKLHKLTHLSLTGIPAFRSAELQQFCRQPPKDFNMSQQLAFCVYSGKGVSELRAFLTELFDRITEMNATDDTEYEEDDDDETYRGDAETEVGNDLDEDDEPPVQQPSPQLAMYRGNHPPAPAVRHGHEFVFQRQRSPRLPAVPPVVEEDTSTDVPSGTANLASVTQRLNAQILAATPVAGPSRRVRGIRQHLTPDFPIVESVSPTASDAASNRSAETNHSNGAGFFRTYQDGGALQARSNGTRTPDLDFAEIGHGRGTQAQTGQVQLTRRHSRPPTSAVQDSLPADRRNTMHVIQSTPNLVQNPQVLVDSSNSDRTGGSAVGWPYREPGSPLGSPSTTRDLHNSMQSGMSRTQPEGEAHGRSVKRSLRSTFNVASSFFGRSSATHEEGGSGSSSNTNSASNDAGGR